MTTKSYLRRFDLAIKRALSIARLIIPKKTGNLRDVSLKMEKESEYVWKIYINTSVAPYAKFVNETPPYPRSKKEADNKQFWQRFVDSLIQQIAAQMGGVANVANKEQK